MKTRFAKLSLTHAVLLFILLIASGGVGYYSAVNYPGESREILDEVAKGFEGAETLDSFSLFLYIFGSNTAKAFLAMTLGFFFGIVPVFFIAVNGFLVGMIGTIIVRQEGLETLLLGIAPHGVFEIPGMILAAAYGLLLGGALWEKIRRGESVRPRIEFALRNFGMYVVPLLALAAAIEVSLTAFLLGGATGQ